MSDSSKVSILDLFDKEQLAKFKDRGDGSLKGPCPSCGDNKDGYGGCIINVSSNTLYCFGSKTSFDLLETVALVKGIISCAEGRRNQ